MGLLKSSAKPLSYLLAASVGAITVYSFEDEQAERFGNYFSVPPEEFTKAYEATLQVHKYLTLEEKCDDSLSTDSFGSGVLMKDSQSDELYILTAEHVTPDPLYTCKSSGKEITVLESSMKTFGLPVTVIKEDEKLDLALLKLEGYVEGLSPYRGKFAEDLKEGEYVLGVGFPRGDKKYFVANVTRKKEKTTVLNMGIIGGNSGGGVYRLQGISLQLIGVVITGEDVTSLEKTREFLRGTPLEDDYL